MGNITVKSIKLIIRTDQSQFIVRFSHAVAALLKELYGLKEASFGVWGLVCSGANPDGALPAAWLPSRGCSIFVLLGQCPAPKTAASISSLRWGWANPSDTSVPAAAAGVAGGGWGGSIQLLQGSPHALGLERASCC